MELPTLPPRVLSFPRSFSSRSYDKLRHTLPDRPYHEDSHITDLQRRRLRNRCLVASVCCLLAVVATVTLGSVLAVRAHRAQRSAADSDDGQGSLSSGSAAIAAACNTTMFPDLCYEWLSADPGAGTADPLRLAGIGVKLALDHVQNASTLASHLNLTSGAVNVTKEAIEDCMELMGLSGDQLNSSISGLSSVSLLTIKSSLSDVKVLLSGTMGFQLACLEGLKELDENGTVSSLIDSQDTVGKAVSISLGLVDTLSKLGSDLTSWKEALPKIHLRRLLSASDEPEEMPDQLSFTDDGFPEWLSAGDRKLLQATPPPTVTASPPPVTPSVPSPQAPPAVTPPPPATTSVSTPTPPSAAGTPPPAAPVAASPPPPSVNASVPSTSTPSANSPPPTTPSTTAAPTTTQAAPTGAASTYDAVVAQDGSGNYATISEAISNVPSKRSTRYTIYIKAGTYKEYVVVPKSMNLLTLVGDGIGLTIITGQKSNLQGSTTYQSATVVVNGVNFIARKITFRNTAGAVGHQAVALRVNGDQAVFDSCSMEGYQDTLYALSNRQFYTRCSIYGTIDFIFGNAIAVFQNCNLLGRQPMPKQFNTFTAQGRKLSSDPSGYSFQLCTVEAAADLQASSYAVSSYFGRPWHPYSRTVFLQSTIGQLISPAGWIAWDASDPSPSTVYYGEYQNTGPGSGTASRVTWKGVYPSMSAQDALSFTVNDFIAGSSWLPSAEVSFQTSL